MSSPLNQIFEDKKIINRIKGRLPFLFQLAEIESSRARKIGMQVGSLRERILIALLVHKFGEKNVETEIPITEPEIDVKVKGIPVSIKTITGKGGVKIVWTVDAKKAREFREAYTPKCDILLVRIEWGRMDKGFFFIPIEVQNKIFKKKGRNGYIKLPKAGTNPRGAEFNKETLDLLLNDSDTKSITINWQRSKIDLKPYQRWVDYWNRKDLSIKRAKHD